MTTDNSTSQSAHTRWVFVTIRNVMNPAIIGTVSLVGAGPGDPGLLTVRGRELLMAADVVVYDALANPRLLNHCPPNAERIFVGKRATNHAMPQEAINTLLVDHARAGKSVVRLKGGDPFVFGRGGEECQALAAAGVPFEVVPGVTAAVAVTAYAGIPVTHRDFNTSVTLLTGHEKEGVPSNTDWATMAKLPCLTLYMGVKSLDGICKQLIAHGMPPTTPAATISNGTTPDQRTVVGTIADLAERVAAVKLETPALTIIGEVVTLRDSLNWFETKPLFGQRIIVTRSRATASQLSIDLESLGASVMEAPTIELHPPADRVAIEQSLTDGTPWDWIIFTSPAGVTFTKQRLFDLNIDVRAFGGAKIAAIGSATAAAIREQLGLRVDLCPAKFVGEALADALIATGEVEGKRFLLLRADLARPVLRERLDTAGAYEVRDIAIYDTRPASELPPAVVDAIDAKRVDWITFTSSSTATNMVALLGEHYRERLSGIRLASIGPITTTTLRELGLEPTITASDSHIAGLVKAMVEAI